MVPSGSRVYQVSALDVDGDVGEITYSISSEEADEMILEIDAKSGRITTTRDLSSSSFNSVKYWVTGMYIVNISRGG